MAQSSILIAGFGGQGILFAGKFLVYTAMLKDKEVTWLPSYGPEMRGGNANCGVIISDTRIGSPMVTNPDYLITMNRPSFDKFESSVCPGGKIFVDSSLAKREAVRSDADCFYIPATRIAEDNGLSGLANMIMIGKLIRETDICPLCDVEPAMKKVVSERKKELIEANIKAVNLGYNYK